MGPAAGRPALRCRRRRRRGPARGLSHRPRLPGGSSDASSRGGAAGAGPGRYLKERGRPAAVGEQDVVGVGARLQRQEAAAEADAAAGTQTAQREALAQRRHFREPPPLARLGTGPETALPLSRGGTSRMRRRPRPAEGEWRKRPRPFGNFRARPGWRKRPRPFGSFRERRLRAGNLASRLGAALSCGRAPPGRDCASPASSSWGSREALPAGTRKGRKNPMRSERFKPYKIQEEPSIFRSTVTKRDRQRHLGFPLFRCSQCISCMVLIGSLPQPVF